MADIINFEDKYFAPIYDSERFMFGIIVFQHPVIDTMRMDNICDRIFKKLNDSSFHKQFAEFDDAVYEAITLSLRDDNNPECNNVKWQYIPNMLSDGRDVVGQVFIY